jgi:uncharacterized protein YbjQ (UPF0145 family)
MRIKSRLILFGLVSLIAVCMLSAALLAGDKDEKKDKNKEKAEKELSATVMTVNPDRPYDVIGMVYFFQGKETSVFGSDAKATQKAVVKKLEDRAVDLGADAIIGTQFISLLSGESGMWVFGTAVRWK